MEDENKPEIQALGKGDVPIPNNHNNKTQICPHCHQEYIPPKRGLGNWKNLFRKPTLSEWTILFMLIGLLFSAYAYNTETASCREFNKNIEFNCMRILATLNQNNSVNPKDFVFSPNLGGEINESHAEQNQTNETYIPYQQ